MELEFSGISDKENHREGRSTHIGAAALYLPDDRQPDAEDGAPPNGKGEHPQYQLHICRATTQSAEGSMISDDSLVATTQSAEG